MAHRRKGKVPKRMPFDDYYPSMRCIPPPKSDPLDLFLESRFGTGRSNRKPGDDIPKKDYGVISKESKKWVFNPKVFIPGTVFESIFWPSKYPEIEYKKTSSGCKRPYSGPEEPDDDEISQIMNDYFPTKKDIGDGIQDCENLDSQQVSCNGNESEEDLNVTKIIGEDCMDSSSLCNGDIINGHVETLEIQKGTAKGRLAAEIPNGTASENCSEHSSETNKKVRIEGVRLELSCSDDGSADENKIARHEKALEILKNMAKPQLPEEVPNRTAFKNGDEHSSETNKKVKIEEIRLELSSSDDDSDDSDVQIVSILPRSQSRDAEIVELKRIQRSPTAQLNGTKHSTFSALEPEIASISKKYNSGKPKILLEQKQSQNTNSIPGNKKQVNGFENGSTLPCDGLDKVLQLQSDFEQLVNMVGKGPGQVCKIIDDEPMDNIDVECVCVSPIRNKKYPMVDVIYLDDSD